MGGIKKYARCVSQRHWRILLPKLNICLNQAIVSGKTSFVHKWAFETRPKDHSQVVFSCAKICKIINYSLCRLCMLGNWIGFSSASPFRRCLHAFSISSLSASDLQCTAKEMCARITSNPQNLNTPN